jgi:hypothetical protein
MHNNIFFEEKNHYLENIIQMPTIGKNPLPYGMSHFIDGHCIISSIFFCSVMFYEPQT